MVFSGRESRVGGGGGGGEGDRVDEAEEEEEAAEAISILACGLRTKAVAKRPRACVHMGYRGVGRECCGLDIVDVA